jgi:outer membrane receptor for Fe3+-dicitrate
MNKKVICKESSLVDIADSIREITGSTDTYNIPELKKYIADTIKSVNRAVPSITLNAANGTITAETYQDKGYVAAGQESAIMYITT